MGTVSTQVFCGDLNGKEIKKGDICIHRAESLCCTAENNIIKQLYTSIKIN